ncbi:MAG: DNA-deoxyinosine glycosylase [Clostridia bacterium]|nr:DNA-deoxyinosine glycosylase [Clostridia bacterium]
MITHPINPVFDKNSKILILGSFPSVKSREEGFFYGNPQNRFWKVLSFLYGEELPNTIQNKKEFLLKHGIAVFDVIKSCDIVGSADSSIKNVVPNDFTKILNNSKINRIFTNGNLAHTLYNKYVLEKTGIKDIKLPSTSPANAAFSLEKLIKTWKIIL